jgi:hypothetical protein
MLDILVSRGHDVLRCQQVHRNDDPDHEHLWYAAENQRVFVTSDGGFVLWHQAWVFWADKWQVHQQHAGILLVPTTKSMRLEAIAEEIDRFVGQSPLLDGEMYILHQSGRWLLPSDLETTR